MAYVEAHAALREHPKTKKAARLLRVAPRDIIGHLLYLWWWCQNYAQDGNLSSCSVEEIAEAADWQQDPHEFVDALINCGRPGEPGFLEIETDGALMVHDWFDYGGKLFKIRAQGAIRQANWRARHTSNAPVTTGNDGKTDGDALVTRHVTQSNAYRGDKIRGEEKKIAPPPSSVGTKTTPSVSSGRKVAADMQALNDKVSAELRIPIVNVLLDITGLRALVDTIGPTNKTLDEQAEIILNDAHTKAITLFEMGYKTDADLLELEPLWYTNWQGKDGSKPTMKQFVEFASKQKVGDRRNGNSVQPYATAVY
jgi:hypothetical protein